MSETGGMYRDYQTNEGGYCAATLEAVSNTLQTDGAMYTSTLDEANISRDQQPFVIDHASGDDHGKNPFKFFVGGIHPDAWDEDVRQHFAQFGPIKEVHVMLDRATGRNRGFGFVTMDDDSSKDAIFTANHVLKDKRLTVREMQPEGTSNLKRKVFIGGINPALNEEDLEPYFKAFGDVEKVTVMRDLEGNSRGFGFVVFVDEESCRKVVDQGVHFIDNENKVECRQAEARGRGPPPRGRGRRERGGGYGAYGWDGRGYGYDEYGEGAAADTGRQENDGYGNLYAAAGWYSGYGQYSAARGASAPYQNYASPYGTYGAGTYGAGSYGAYGGYGSGYGADASGYGGYSPAAVADSYGPARTPGSIAPATPGRGRGDSAAGTTSYRSSPY